MTRRAVATNDPDDERTWMSTAETAKYLGVTPRRLYALIDEQFLPAERFARGIRLRRDRVERFASSPAWAAARRDRRPGLSESVMARRWHGSGRHPL
jgi:excisionase family DNA binding protein